MEEEQQLQQVLLHFDTLSKGGQSEAQPIHAIERLDAVEPGIQGLDELLDPLASLRRHRRLTST